MLAEITHVDANPSICCRQGEESTTQSHCNGICPVVPTELHVPCVSPCWMYSKLLLSVPQPLSCRCWDLILAEVAGTRFKAGAHDLLSHSMFNICEDRWQPQSHPHLQTVPSQVVTDEVFCRGIIPVILMRPHGGCNTVWILCGDYVDWHQKTVSRLCSPEDVISHCHRCYCYLCSGF